LTILKSRLEESKSQANELQRTLDEKMITSSKLSDDNNQLQQRVNALVNELQQQQTAWEVIQTELDREKETNQNLVNEIRFKEDEIENLTSNLAKLEKENSSWLKKVKSAKEEKTILEGTMSETVMTLTNEKKALLQILEDLKQDHSRELTEISGISYMLLQHLLLEAFQIS
jgi:chromosome segregation ATPase